MNPAVVTKAGAGLAALITTHAMVNARILRRPRAVVADIDERVCLLIPARNEAERIGPCLRAALLQVGVPDFEIVVLDDGSTDATSAVVKQFVHPDAEILPGPALRLLNGGDAPLPDGWLGKPWACERLRRSVEADVVIFIDADVRLGPNAVAASVALLRESGLDLISPYPRQEAISFGERVVQPLLQWLWLSFLPLRIAERTRPNSMAAANGQFLVMDSTALDQVGGFTAVRGEALDDVALVRAFKRNDRRGGVVDGTEIATCRMYTDWSSLKAGYTKNLWAGTGSVGGATALGSMFVLAYLVPPLAAIGLLGRQARPAGVFGYLAGVVGRIVSAQRTGGRVSDSALHPLSIAALLHLLAGSWRAKRAGTIEWKGRNLG